MTKGQKLLSIQELIQKTFSITEPIDIQSMIFVAGLQTLGKPSSTLSRDQKMDVLHIGTCAILEPYGYYKLSGRDADGWPIYDKMKDIDPNDNDPDELIKDALIRYFQL